MLNMRSEKNKPKFMRPAGEIPRSPEQEQDEEKLGSYEIAKRKNLSGGANVSEFIVLKDDGAGVWKPKDGENREIVERHANGDLYVRERAAYLVDLFLGFDLVPPTVIREIGGYIGSLQKFVPDAILGYQAKRRMPERQEYLTAQFQTMRLFDFIVSNSDRNVGNYLVTESGKVAAIDHGICFPQIPCELSERVIDYEFPDDVVSKIKDLAGSESKLSILRALLVELIGEKRTDACLARLTELANIFKDNKISARAARWLNYQVGAKDIPKF